MRRTFPNDDAPCLMDEIEAQLAAGFLLGCGAPRRARLRGLGDQELAPVFAAMRASMPRHELGWFTIGRSSSSTHAGAENPRHPGGGARGSPEASTQSRG